NIIPVLLFGLSDITTRFWSVVSGIALIPLTFFISYFFTKKTKTSLFASFIVTFSPWSIIESRLGYENHLSFVITLAAILLLLFHFGLIEKSIRNIRVRKYSLIASIVLLEISIFTYAAQRIFIPVFVFVLLLLSFFNNGFNKHMKKILLVFVLVFITTSCLIINPKFRGRASEEVWKLDQERVKVMEEYYHAAGISQIKIHPRVTWLLHNKYTYSALDFSERYLDHFSPQFLFFKGEASDENIPGMGVLLLVEMILLPLGLISFLSKNKNGKSLLLFAWLLISPIPSALTKGGAHINRASLMIVPLSIFSGYGLGIISDIRYKRLKILAIIFTFLFTIWSILYSLHQIFIVKPILRSWYKQQVNRELTQKVLSYKDEYSSVVVTDDDYIFYLFYGKVKPNEFLGNADIKPASEAKWERVDRWGNIYFKMPYRCPLSGKEKVLYVCKGDEVPQNSELVDIVYYSDGLPAYTFVEFYPLSERPQPLPELPQRLHYMVGIEKEDGNPDGIISEEHDSFW
ncbi:hypothetical protein ACFL25_01315, partial [Patescibacteria group bacterium]